MRRERFTLEKSNKNKRAIIKTTNTKPNTKHKLILMEDTTIRAKNVNVTGKSNPLDNVFKSYLESNSHVAKATKGVGSRTHRASISTSSMVSKENYLDFSYGRCGPMDKWIETLKKHCETPKSSNIVSLIWCCSSIDCIPDHVAKLSKLQKLDCSFNALRNLESDLFSGLSKLSSLDLKSNSLKELPDGMAHLTRLQQLVFLDISRNEIPELPEAMFIHCKRIETLLLNHNKITSIPNEIKNLTMLKKLNLASNLIETLPNSLLHLPSIVHLDISNNRINELTIPGSIEGSTGLPWALNMKELLVHGNNITEVPAEISKLEKLELLDISRTRVEIIPVDLASLVNLEEIVLDLEDKKSCIKLPPLSICQQGTMAILDYLKDVQKGVPDAKFCKIIGEGFVAADKLNLAGSYADLNSPSATVDDLPRLYATDQASFKILSVDKFGREKRIGGDVFNVVIQEVLVSDAGGLSDKYEKITLLDNGDGSYTGIFSIKRVGVYEIHIKCGVEHVAESPYRIRVIPGRIYAPNCRVIGSGLEKGHVGTEGRFQLIPCDKFMNLITKAKAWQDSEVVITASWIHHTQPEGSKLSFKTRIERNEDGTLWIHYLTTTSGLVALNIKIRREEMFATGSLLEIPIEAGPTYPFNCTASLTGLQRTEVGVRTSFIVKAKDRYGNSRTCGGDLVLAFLINPDGLKSACEVLDSLNGEYYVSYMAPTHGLFKVEVGIQANAFRTVKKIMGSPFELQVSDKKDDLLLQHQSENQKLANDLADLNRKYLEVMHLLEKEKETSEGLHRMADNSQKQHESEISNLVKNMEHLDIKFKEKEKEVTLMREKLDERVTNGGSNLKPPEIMITSTSESNNDDYQAAESHMQFDRSASIDGTSKQENSKLKEKISEGTFESFSLSEYIQSDVKENSVLIFDPKNTKTLVDVLIAQAQESRICILPYPAHIIFMCAKWGWNQFENSNSIKELIQYSLHIFRTEARKSISQREADSLELWNLFYWFSNTIYLLGSIRSDLKAFKLRTTSELDIYDNASIDVLGNGRDDKRAKVFTKSNEIQRTTATSSNHDSEPRSAVKASESHISVMNALQDELIEASEEMYESILRALQQAFPAQNILSAMSEGSSNHRNSYFKTLRGSSKSQFGVMIDNFGSLLSQLRVHNIEMGIQLQIFSSLFGYVNAILFNHLVAKKVGSGVIMAMRVNLQNLQDWAIDQDIRESNHRLVHVTQTLDLLGFLPPKFTLDHADAIAATVSTLNESQLYKLLKLYGEKVSKDCLIATVQHFRGKQIKALGANDPASTVLDMQALKNETGLSLDSNIKGSISLSRVIHEPLRLPRNLRIQNCKRAFISDAAS